MRRRMVTGRFKANSLGIVAFVCLVWAVTWASEQKNLIFNDVVLASKETQPDSTKNWPLPPPGPARLRDKTLVYIGEDLRNAGILGVGAGIREAASSMGWQVRFFNAGGDDDTKRTIFEQALKIHPDGVVLGSIDVRSADRFLKPFQLSGIPIIGWHVAPFPGPLQDSPIQLNVATNSIEVAKVAAKYVIAQSKGTAKVVIFTDNRFSIAKKKAEIMAGLIRNCENCKLLEVVDLPLDKTASLMQGTTDRLFRDYGENWQYSLAINDLYFDNAVAALVLNGRPPEGPPVNISAGDGSPSALLRIRYGSYQRATVPEPLLLQGWQLVDEMNRIFQGKPPSGYQVPAEIITRSNLKRQYNRLDLFDPENGYRKAYQDIWMKD